MLYSMLCYITRGLVPRADDTQAEWVTYQYSTAYPILCWLPLKHAEWTEENLGQELKLAIPAKYGDMWTVKELNQILFKSLVSSGPSFGHLRTFGAVQWECELSTGMNSMSARAAARKALGKQMSSENCRYIACHVMY